MFEIVGFIVELLLTCETEVDVNVVCVYVVFF